MISAIIGATGFATSSTTFLNHSGQTETSGTGSQPVSAAMAEIMINSI